MASSATLNNRMSSTRQRRASSLKPMSTSTCKARIRAWNFRSWRLRIIKLSKMKSLSVTNWIDWSNTLIKWWRTSSICKVRLMLLTGTCPTWITRTTAFRRNLRNLCRPTMLSEWTSIESIRLKIFEQELTTLLRDHRQKLPGPCMWLQAHEFSLMNSLQSRRSTGLRGRTLHHTHQLDQIQSSREEWPGVVHQYLSQAPMQKWRNNILLEEKFTQVSSQLGRGSTETMLVDVARHWERPSGQNQAAKT